MSNRKKKIDGHIDMEEKEKVKRKFVYCQQPMVYEIDGCPQCKGRNVTWSEYVNHLWCFDCEIDYIPEHSGIFDGPIAIELCSVLGISFDRIEIETGKLIKYDSPEWNSSRP